MSKNRIPLDMYDVMPDEQRAYLSNYGKHFNSKMCEFAVKMMRDRKGSRVEMVKKEDLEKKMKDVGVTILNSTLGFALSINFSATTFTQRLSFLIALHF